MALKLRTLLRTAKNSAEGEFMKCVMIDCSRNAVMNVKSVKKFAETVKSLGFDSLMLYTEDTFEVDNEPYFGYMRGRYSKDEIKELDAFCNNIGIELIPCIQTLAHLNAIFKWWDEYMPINDCDDILLCGEERTYTLIDNIFKTLSECYSTRKVHIGMDEAYRVGLGKYLDKHGYEKRFDIINRHLHRVCEIADKYGFKPMLWSDMFVKLALNSTEYYAEANLDEIRAAADLPENVSLVYWDYYSKDYDRYKKMINVNKAFDRPVLFAGGAWTWRGFAPDNKFSFETTEPALRACRDCGIEDIIITVWGDDGGECSPFAVLPALSYASSLLNGNGTLEEAKGKFEELTGMSFGDMTLLDELDKPSKKLEGAPSKYLIYNDPFSGMVDYMIESGVNEYYEKLKLKLEAVKPAEAFKEMFDFYISLCGALAVKSELGIKTRAAYDKKDKQALLKLAESDYTLAIERINECHKAYRKLWLKFNKPFGFDIQDIRFGGVIKRLETCKTALIEFCEGKTDTIPELDERLLSGIHRGTTWARTVTANVISHIC